MVLVLESVWLLIWCVVMLKDNKKFFIKEVVMVKLVVLEVVIVISY